MILLIDPDKTTRKKLCDLLNRERIINVESIPELLEMFCKFQKNIDIMIVHVHVLYEILSRGTLFKLCEKLYVTVPPVLGFYKKGEEAIKIVFREKYKEYEVIEYNEENENFPEEYIRAIRKLYPNVIVDSAKARETWREKEEKVTIDSRTWLEKEGFLDSAETTEKNYKELYNELKKKYDSLVAQIQKLYDSAKNE